MLCAQEKKRLEKELHYRIPFGLVSFADCLNSRFVNLLVGDLSSITTNT